MAVEITIRHLEIGDAVKAQAREKADRLVEKFPDVEFVHAVLEKDGPFFSVMIAVQGGNNNKVESSAKRDNVIEALQDAFDKSEAQLRKNAQRSRESRK